MRKLYGEYQSVINVIFYKILPKLFLIVWVVGSGDSAGLLPVPGRPTALAYSKAGACCACSRCGTGGLFFCCFFHLIYPIFLF